MSLWTCPTHGLHGPCPGNVCPTCGAAMSWATTRPASVSHVSWTCNDCGWSGIGWHSCAGRSRATFQPLVEAFARAAAAEGAEVRPAASGEESPTRGLSCQHGHVRRYDDVERCTDCGMWRLRIHDERLGRWREAITWP